MSFFSRLRMKRPKTRLACKQESRLGGRETPFEEVEQKESKAKTGVSNRFIKWWQGLSWRRRLLVVLGAAGVVLGSWFGAQWYFTPSPTYSLTVAVAPSGSGSINPSHGDYDEGTQVTLTATPLVDYEFVSWSGGASGTSLTVTLEMDSDKTVVANFRTIEYTLTTQVSPAVGGQVIPSNGRYTSGSSVTLTAAPSEDYEFVSWSGDASGTSPTVTLEMDSDKTVVAQFMPTRQRITYTMESGISGSVVVYTNDLESGDTVEGFAELTGKVYAQDWTFRWTLEIFGPEGREMHSWYQGHWVERNHRDFVFKAPYRGTYKIRVTHNSLYVKCLVIEIKPKGWTLKSP